MTICSHSNRLHLSQFSYLVFCLSYDIRRYLVKLQKCCLYPKTLCSAAASYLHWCITNCNVANSFLSIRCYYHLTYAEYSCNRHHVWYVYGFKCVCRFCNVLIFVPSMLKCGNFSVALRSTSTVQNAKRRFPTAQPNVPNYNYCSFVCTN